MLLRRINGDFIRFLYDIFTSIIFDELLLIGFACRGKLFLHCWLMFRAISDFAREESYRCRGCLEYSKVKRPFEGFSGQFKRFVLREHRREMFCRCCILDLSSLQFLILPWQFQFDCNCMHKTVRFSHKTLFKKHNFYLSQERS